MKKWAFTLLILAGLTCLSPSASGQEPGWSGRVIAFGEQRAQMIAVTETTRAFAEGERQAGLELKEKYPDVPVVKTWMTNEDERVCPICGGLDGQEVAIDEAFEFEGVEYPEPPAHPNCRCWMSSRTRING